MITALYDKYVPTQYSKLISNYTDARAPNLTNLQLVRDFPMEQQTTEVDRTQSITERIFAVLFWFSVGISISFVGFRKRVQNVTYNLCQNQKSTNTAFYLENTTDNVANFCF
jgi:hypothetical protein